MNAEYLRADHQLRALLFGNGDTNSGHVKGEDARLAVAAHLFEMSEAMIDMEANLRASQVLVRRLRERQERVSQQEALSGI